MSAPFERKRLTRLHESLWSYKTAVAHTEEIRLQTPHFVVAEKAYRLAHFATQHIDQKMAQERCDLVFEMTDSKLQGKWKVVWQNEETKLIRRILQWFPLTRTIFNNRIAHGHILPVDQRAENVAYEKSADFVPLLLSKIALQPFPWSYETFCDPFTQLATLAFQTVETVFQSERKVKGSFRFVVDFENNLHLVRVQDVPSQNEKEENKKAVSLFYEFALSEYGKEEISYLEQAYGFYFAQMIRDGEPLLPDHIFKTNVGVNTILLCHVEAFYEKLLKVHAEKKIPKGLFPYRQKRAILKAFSCPRELEQFLGKVPPASFKKLSSEKAAFIVELIMPTSHERERAFTGRKIVHRAIWGWTCDDEMQRENPAADLFELMHLFSQLETSSWQHYFELLAHVVVKKNLFASYLVDDTIEIYPGLLIPAPMSEKGGKRWYYSEAVVSDQEGNFNYVLLGVCPEDQLPMIKLYRSTVSECNNIDWIGSIKADLNPYGSPGPLTPDKASQYEKGDIESRSLAVWVGYLVMYQKYMSSQIKKEQALMQYALRHALVEYMRAYPEKKIERPLFGKEAIYQFLLEEAHHLQEMPCQKITSDIVFCGQSLGATLSEYYLAKTLNRCPLPGRAFTCYSANAPAIDDELDLAFMEFGRRHKLLFSALGIRYKIIRQFEYGDIFAQGGGTHLGTSGYRDDDASWLEEHNYVFRPRDDAVALAITTLPTHGRRMGGAVQDKDYTIVPISPQELYEFDHAWWLSSDLRKIFGFRLLQSPELIDRFRKLVGHLMQPIFVVLEKRSQKVCKKIVNRDEQGVLYARYQNITNRTKICKID